MVLALIAFVLVSTAVLLGGSLIYRRRRRIAARLDRIQHMEDQEGDVLRLPLSQRVFYPILGQLAQGVASLAPAQLRGALERKLAMAGAVYRQRSQFFLGLQVLLALFFPVLALLVGTLVGMPGLRLALWMGLGVAAGVMLPLGWLELVVNRRQRSMENDLPSVLDLLVISVEAGLGFDMAMARVTEKVKGELADEFSYALNEIRLGRVRRLALRDMAARTGVADLSSFISAVIQADQLGVEIGNVLRVQADAMRVRRRQRFEEQAMKAPIKMLFPLVFFIFPALFIVILGPPALQIMQTFAEM